jgi:hypothetical protein
MQVETRKIACHGETGTPKGEEEDWVNLLRMMSQSSREVRCGASAVKLSPDASSWRREIAP